MKLKIGVVGVGRVFEHYLYLSKMGLLPQIEFRGLFDKNQIKLQEVSQRESIHSFNSLDKLLSSSEIDAVFILTPSGDHFESARQSILKKKPTLIEKPICLKVDEAHELQRLAEIENVYIQSVLQNRFNPAVQELRKLIDPEKTITVITGGLRLRWSRESTYYQDDWHGTWKMDGGVVSQQAIHHIFALDELFGPMDKVLAAGFQRKHLLEAEDTAVGIFVSKNGVPFTFELTTAVSKSDVEASISVITSAGIFNLGGQALNRLSVQEPGEIQVRELVKTDIPSGYGLGHVQEINNFVNAVLKGDVTTDLTDSIRALVLVHSIYSSMEEGKMTKISDHAKSIKLGQ